MVRSTRRRISSRSYLPYIRRGSARIQPTVRLGFRLLAGSWNTIWGRLVKWVTVPV